MDEGEVQHLSCLITKMMDVTTNVDVLINSVKSNDNIYIFRQCFLRNKVRINH